MTNDQKEALMRAFERIYGCNEHDRAPEGHYVDQNDRLAWIAFKHGWQSALASMPRFSEEELAAVLRAAKPERLIASQYSEFNDGSFEERIEYIQTDLAKARAILNAAPHLRKEQ